MNLPLFIALVMRRYNVLYFFLMCFVNDCCIFLDVVDSSELEIMSDKLQFFYDNQWVVKQK